MKLPQVRTAEIVVQDLGQELLIYDLKTHKAYTINETLKLVFEACDGATSFDLLKRKHKFTDDLIRFALDELKPHDLLIGYQGNNSFPGLSRREVIKKVGRASMIALPIIAGITAPTAMQAASGVVVTCVGQPCIGLGQCAAPCSTCNGTGTCSVGRADCSAIGSSCNGTVTGTCDAIGGGLGICSVGSRLACFTPGGTCTDIAQGTCTGAGTCA